MKKFFCAVVFVFIGVLVFAQQKPVVAVAPFDAISGVTTEEASVITRVFNNRLGNTNIVTLVDRSIIDRVIKEHQFQLGDWSNPQKTAEFGKALNADWVVRGELERLGAGIIVTVSFFDIRTFQFMGGADIPLANVNEAYEKITPLVDSLVQTINSGGSVPGSSGRTDSGTTVPPRSAVLVFSGDTLAARERQTITAGMRSAMQSWNTSLDIKESSQTGTIYGYAFTVTIYRDRTTYDLLQAEVTVAFSHNGRILCQSDPYYITETTDTLIARRVAERLRDDRAFFSRVNEASR